MILVVGATGYLGGMVTRKLLERGNSVRILARPQSSYQPLADVGAQVVFGDLKERGSLDAACQGADIVITTANSITRGGEDTIQTVDLEGNRHLIDAARAADVRQFIFVSALGADQNSPAPFMRAKGATEDHLRGVGMPYTIFKPNGYMEVMVHGVIGMPAMQGHPVVIVGSGSRKHSFISASDVAAFILAATGNATAINQSLPVGGPQPLSFRDAIAIYERVLGHQVAINSVALGEPVPGLPEMVAQLLASLDMYDSPMDMTDMARAFGVELTPLEDVVRRITVKAATV